MDAVVRDATMLGASAIAPFISEHVSVSSTAWRRAGATGRWQRVAVSSAKQCQRAVVPRIEAVRPLTQLIDDSTDRMIVAAVEPAAQNDLSCRFTKTAKRQLRSTALALVGPEGGWSRSEIALLKDRGAEFVHLGPRTLRAETAPTVLLSVLWTTWGW
jgi:16S rRNA (uracil1498-N3)-methyltransferase